MLLQYCCLSLWRYSFALYAAHRNLCGDQVVSYYLMLLHCSDSLSFLQQSQALSSALQMGARQRRGRHRERMEPKSKSWWKRKLKGFVAARKGEREDMQDAHVLLNDFSAEVSPLPARVSRLSYFAVFDGHGGARASRFAAQNLHLNLASKFPKGCMASATNMEKMVKKSLLDSFKQTDDDFLKHASSQKPAWKDGSTATCVLVVDDVLFIANLGDSRAVLCRAAGEDSKKMSTLALSKEHNPTQYEERMRIQRAGGTVRDGRVLGLLEVSRSLGDGQYKRCGVISTPHLRRCQLTPNDRFLLLACDGLFKVFSPEEAVSFVVPILEEETLEQKEGKTLQDTRFETACNRLANEAVRRGCADNVTVLLVNIEH
ncbi:integrin-linked kinase-associated serine/threonine phosphatase 2C isoform X2 [Acipenser oxyrinchus oxyrinchus]|uniref:Integrin-linked kinase-associated serine/threonine phosphatase 2C n=1 Tax=Acipenser oxyrinchus oxyrinchus TaxID=40147 RepID=A0AAD8DGQ3_ACIOX|nr:integrin-linked kinase-associated serine/threonine phosphatase 2C isoform X2 [Acipenser oxyrinchus oxyrinchus]